MRRILTRSWLLSAALVVATATPRPVLAQSLAGEEPAGDDVNEVVARALFEQGLKLFHQGSWSDARQLFAESIARSPVGPYARSARQMLARCNERLGLAPPGWDEPSPPAPDRPVDPYGVEPEAGGPALLDPYATPDAPAAPVDPYASPADELGDPYAEAGAPTVPTPLAGADQPRSEKQAIRSSLAVFGGAYGLYATLGLAAGFSDDIGDGQVLLMLGGAAAGGATGYYLGEHKTISRAQVGTVASSTGWGAGLGLLLAHAADAPEPAGCDFCTDDQPAGDYLLASAVTSTLALGAGTWLAFQEPGLDDVSLVNSLGGYGLLGSLMLGVAADPADGRSYSVSAALGTTAGLATGLWLARRIDVPRQRMAYVDAGVGAGALTPWVLYALGGGGGGDARQLTGAASLGLGALGGWLAWRWTRGRFDDAPAASGGLDADELAASPPALLSRGLRGDWSLRPVAPRPLVLAPAAADPRARVGLGIDLLAGSFSA